MGEKPDKKYWSWSDRFRRIVVELVLTTVALTLIGFGYITEFKLPFVEVHFGQSGVAGKEIPLKVVFYLGCLFWIYLLVILFLRRQNELREFNRFDDVISEHIAKISQLVQRQADPAEFSGTHPNFLYLEGRLNEISSQIKQSSRFPTGTQGQVYESSMKELEAVMGAINEAPALAERILAGQKLEWERRMGELRTLLSGSSISSLRSLAAESQLWAKREQRLEFWVPVSVTGSTMLTVFVYFTWRLFTGNGG